jgi:hypothetical protein
MCGEFLSPPYQTDARGISVCRKHWIECWQPDAADWQPNVTWDAGKR